MSARPEVVWPELAAEDWLETQATLHRWMQMVGQVKLALAPPLNHFWHAALELNARGLGTGPIPLPDGAVQIDFDFFDHILIVSTGDGRQRRFTLPGRSVAGFHREFLATLAALGIRPEIPAEPLGLDDTTPFAADRRNTYDQPLMQRFWRLMLQSARVLEVFRGRYRGKAGPLQFFWSGFELSLSRYPGQPAPPHPPVPGLGEEVVQEIYAEAVYTAGLLPGGDGEAEPLYYLRAWPEPEGFRSAMLKPAAARYRTAEFVLPYHVVREAEQPDETLLGFLQSGWEAAAGRAGWE